LVDRIDGGLTNTIHRVVRQNGEVLAIKDAKKLPSSD